MINNQALTAPQTPRWYCLNNMGMATLCADKADAEDVARTCDMEWPRQSPHRAVQLVEAPKIHYPMAEPVAWMWRVADSDWQLESTCPPARPLAIVEPLYTGYMAAKAGLAHRKAVQEAVREALHEAKKACENLPAPEACSGVERSLWDVATMACAEAVGNVGTP